MCRISKIGRIFGPYYNLGRHQCSIQNKSAIKDWPQPKTVIELQQFLRLCNYYYRSILGYARVESPLSDLLRGKPSSLQFSGAQIQAFQQFKNYLVSAPILKIYDPEFPIRVQSDASKLVIGAILERLYSINWHPVQQFSKQLNDPEIQYYSTEREMLGYILALQHWWQYLIGKNFDILTDHVPNQYILYQQNLSYHNVFWVEVLLEYDANFIYKPDHVHSIPDAISCIPVLNAVLDINDNGALLEAVRTAQLLRQDK